MKSIREIEQIVASTLGIETTGFTSEQLLRLELALISEDGHPPELTLPRADYEACKEARRMTPGEMLSAYIALERKYNELASKQPIPFNKVTTSDLLRVANQAFGETVDHDFGGNPITDYDVLLYGAYGPGILRLINLALVKFAPSELSQAVVKSNMDTMFAGMNEEQFYKNFMSLVHSPFFQQLAKKHDINKAND